MARSPWELDFSRDINISLKTLVNTLAKSFERIIQDEECVLWLREEQRKKTEGTKIEVSLIWGYEVEQGVGKEKTSRKKKHICQWNVFILQANLRKSGQKYVNFLSKDLKQNKNQWQKPEQVIKQSSSVPSSWECKDVLQCHLLMALSHHQSWTFLLDTPNSKVILT